MNLLEELFGMQGPLAPSNGVSFGSLSPVRPQAQPVGAAPPPTAQPSAAPASFLQPSSGFDDVATFFDGMKDGSGLLSALGAGSKAVTAESERRGRVNQTYNWLLKNNVAEDEAKMIMANPDLLKAKIGQLTAPKTMTLNPGQKVIGSDGKVIFDNSEAMKPTPDQSNYQFSQSDPKFRDFLNEQKRGGQSAIEMSPEQRAALAKEYGVDINSDVGRAWVLAGKWLREDQQALSATDKKEIFKSEDALPVLDSTIDALTRAKDLNGKSYTGYTADIRANIGSKAPDWMVPDAIADPQSASDTREFNSIMSMEAIKSMAETLKGATTDRELDRFVEILGDPATPPEIRGRTIDRMLALANRQKQIATNRLEQMRGGTYFKPQSEAGQQPAPSGLGGAPVRAKNANGDVIEFNGKDWVPVGGGAQ